MNLLLSSLCFLLGFGAPGALNPETPSASAKVMLDQGRESLARELSRALAIPPGRANPAVQVETIFGLGALASSNREAVDPHGALIAQGRGWLRSLGNSDGSFLAPPDQLEATWYALLALATSTQAADRESAARAREFLQRLPGAQSASLASSDTTTAAPPSIQEALSFLKKTTAGRDQSPQRGYPSNLSPRFDPGSHAGREFDLRAARRLILRDPLASLTRQLGLPDRGGRAQDIHLAALVLADLGSPRCVDEQGRTRRWPEELLRELGALNAIPPGQASLAATAASVLALVALEPWVIAIPDASLEAAAGREKSEVAVLPADCLGCHEKLHAGIVHHWRQSTHALRDVGCDACHGKNHSQIFRDNGAVSPLVCGGCHARQASEFARSRHATAETTLLKSALFAATPAAARASCLSCHAIGKSHADGSFGACNFCHSSHSTSSAEAREPEACTVCHTGEDYPQDLAYRLSRHGAIYYRTRDPLLAPTCASCHQAGGDHGTSFGITVGGAGAGGHGWPEEPAVPMEAVSAERFSQERAAMVRVCVPCHSSRFAEDSLQSADRLKRDGNLKLLEAKKEILALQAEGFLGKDRAQSSRPGGLSVRADAGTPGSEVLNLFHDMWRFHYAWSWKGAYHSSPGVSNLESRPGLDDDLGQIRAAAARLRQEGKK